MFARPGGLLYLQLPVVTPCSSAESRGEHGFVGTPLTVAALIEMVFICEYTVGLQEIRPPPSILQCFQVEVFQSLRVW